MYFLEFQYELVVRMIFVSYLFSTFFVYILGREFLHSGERRLWWFQSSIWRWRGRPWRPFKIPLSLPKRLPWFSYLFPSATIVLWVSITLSFKIKKSLLNPRRAAAVCHHLTWVGLKIDISSPSQLRMVMGKPAATPAVLVFHKGKAHSHVKEQVSSDDLWCPLKLTWRYSWTLNAPGTGLDGVRSALLPVTHVPTCPLVLWLSFH